MALETIKIAELPSATQVVGDDYLVVEQPDKTKKATIAQVISDLDLANKEDLSASGGASLIGASDGTDVQQSLDTARANERELWRRALHDLGLTLVEGSFEDGATLTYATDAIWHIAGAQCYTWGGTFPKTVPAKSTPSTTGGISASAWVTVGDLSLLDEVTEIKNEAVEAKDQAEDARDEAQAYALQASELGNLYASVSEGLAATTDGQYFQVPQGSGSSVAFKVYKNNAGVAQEVAAVPGTGAIINTVREYATLGDAQSEVAAGTIKEGGACWVNSTDTFFLADEYVNTAGTLSPTGRSVVSKSYIDEIKNRIPTADRSLYWGGIVAADGSIGISFRTDDNEPVFGKYGALSSLTSAVTPFPNISSGMSAVNVNSSFLVAANQTDNLVVPTVFNKTSLTTYVKLFSMTTDEQVETKSDRSGFWIAAVAENGQIGWGVRSSDNRLILGNGGDIVKRVELLENNTSTSKNSSDTYGDSTAAGTGGTPFPTQLAALIGNGFVANNYGIGGQKSGQVAMRSGAIPIYLTVTGNAIPVSGASVTITQINGVSATAEPAYPSQDVRFLSTASSSATYTLDGWISGIKCRVTRTVVGGVESYTLTALNGSGFRCLPGSLFVPEYAMHSHSDSEMWICVGINDFRSGATTAADYDADVAAIKYNIDAMVNQAEKYGRPVLVYGLNTCNYAVEYLGGIRYQRILEVNQYLSQKYPRYYVRGANGRDLREELVSRYNPSVSQDVTDFGNDIVPSTLRSDNRHPNTTGYGVYADLGYQTRQRGGY